MIKSSIEILGPFPVASEQNNAHTVECKATVSCVPLSSTAIYTHIWLRISLANHKKIKILYILFSACNEINQIIKHDLFIGPHVKCSVTVYGPGGNE